MVDWFLKNSEDLLRNYEIVQVLEIPKFGAEKFGQRRVYSEANFSMVGNRQMRPQKRLTVISYRTIKSRGRRIF